MRTHHARSAALLGVPITTGLAVLGYLPAGGMPRSKPLDRTVSVKGLAERELAADVAIWTIKFNEASNELGALYAGLNKKPALDSDFLVQAGFQTE